MTDPLFWRYWADALIPLFMIPLVLLFVPFELFRVAKPVRCALAIAMGMVGGCVVLFKLAGATLFTCWLVGLLLPVSGLLILLFCLKTNRGQSIFLLATLALDTAMCQALTGGFVLRSNPLWLPISFLVTLIQAFFLWRFFRKPLLNMLFLNHIHWGKIIILPLSLCFMISGYSLSFLTHDARLVPLWPTLCLCAVVVLVYVTLYRFQSATLQQVDIQQSAAILRLEVDALEKQAVMLDAAAEQLRVFRHDIRHYIVLLQGCLDADKPDAAREILETMRCNVDAPGAWSTLTAYTGQPMIDTVLSQAKAYAAQLKVEFEVSLTLPDELRVDVAEFAVVILNALENAILAASQEPADAPHRVTLRNLPCKKQLFLVVSNSFSGELKVDERIGLPLSSKEGHGYGTRSIASFALKYDCMLDCRLRDGMFHLRLLI